MAKHLLLTNDFWWQNDIVKVGPVASYFYLASLGIMKQTGYTTIHRGHISTIGADRHEGVIESLETAGLWNPSGDTWIVKNVVQPGSIKSTKEENRLGCVYVYDTTLEVGETRLYKVGQTKHLTNRIQSFKSANPYGKLLLAGIYSVHARAMEKVLHNIMKKEHYLGEMFALDEENLDWLISFMTVSSDQYLDVTQNEWVKQQDE